MSEHEQPKPFVVTWHLLGAAVLVNLLIVFALAWAAGAMAARPLCGPIAPDRGARTIAELQAQLAAVGPPNAENTAPCQVAPDLQGFAPNAPDAHTAPAGSNAGKYHYIGHQTTNPSHSGVWAQIEVGNPPVDLRGLGTDDEFHAARILAEGPAANGYWAEIGWIDKSWSTSTPSQPGPGNACVYTSKNPDTTIVTYCASLPLTSGSLYTFVVKQAGAVPGANNVQMDIFYGGVWYTLANHTSMHCTNTNTSPNCTWEAFYEVYSEDNDPHEGLGPTNPISFVGMHLLPWQGSWILWANTIASCWEEYASPYEYANSTIYENFEARGTGVWPDPTQPFCGIS